MAWIGLAQHAGRGCVRSFSPSPIRMLRPALASSRFSGGLATTRTVGTATLRFSPAGTRTTTTTASSPSSSVRLFYAPFPENLYREWTLDQDRLLWSNRAKPSSEVAVLLGRGIRGVEKRLKKLRDVESSAYRRLFVGDNHNDVDNTNGETATPNNNNNSSSSSSRKKKLPPSSDVLRRIEWDTMLDEADFCVLHYDRVEGTLVNSPLTAPNESIDSGETSLIRALPEHRIVSILYRERVVWDRRANRKHDVFFGSPGILSVQETYDDWKARKDARRASQSKLRMFWRDRWEDLLLSPSDRDRLLHETEELLADGDGGGNGAEHQPYREDGSDGTVSTLTHEEQNHLDAYVDTAFQLFRNAVERTVEDGTSAILGDGGGSNDDRGKAETAGLVSLLDELSEWIASPCWSCFEYDDIGAETGAAGRLRETLLRKLSSTMDRLEGKKPKSSHRNKKQQQQQQQQLLLNEKDIEETFVRGSGSGGQKINKTSNRVVLVHIPTGIKVECQETRSLQQNRKIGRKRLLEKLDAHYHGSGSRRERKKQEIQSKKKKKKSKNKSRLAAKQEAKRQKKKAMQQQAAHDGDDDGF